MSYNPVYCLPSPFTNPFTTAWLCFPHTAVASTYIQWTSKAVNILALDPTKALILYFLSHGKGSKHKSQMAEPRLSFGEELHLGGELVGHKGGEKGKINGFSWKCERKLSRGRTFVSTTQCTHTHTHTHTHWNTSTRISQGPTLLYRSWAILSRHIPFHTWSQFPAKLWRYWLCSDDKSWLVLFH